MKRLNSLENRIVALVLSIVLVLGMFPAGVFAVDNSSAYGTVEGLSEGISVSGDGAEVTATFAGSLNWVAADTSIGRTKDGWWAGIQVNAPESVDLEKAQFTLSGVAYSFDENKDSADDAESHYICIWKYIDAEKLRAANLDTGIASYEYTFDWDGDSVFEQTVYLKVDASKTILYNNDSTQAYPAAELGYGKVGLLTEGANITGNESATVSVAYNEDITIDWVAADTSIGRYQDGWWAGIKITAPTGMTENQLKNAQLKLKSGVVSFWDNKDTQEGADAHWISIWVPLNDLLSGSMANRTYQLDWNNDGLFEQSVVLSLDSEKITLTKAGMQVYPVLGQVTSYSGGAVTGSGTGVVDVLINEVTLDWVEADDSTGRTQGWWTGIRVEAPDGFDSSVLQNSKLQVKRTEDGSWEVLNFWDVKDSADNATVHYVGLWIPVSPSTLQEYAEAGKNITRWYRFDWNNDGTYEQEISFSIDPAGNIVLNKVDQTGFAFAVATPDDIWVGDVNYQNVAVGGQGDGAITYEIISGDAATVDAATGELTFTKAGTVTVQATKAADSEGYYNAVSAQYTITAVKEDQYPKFEKTSPGMITYEPGLTFENEVVEVLGGSVTYTITEGADVAAIDAATGKLTVIKAGTVTVKAEISDDVNYNPAEATYTLVIDKAEQTGFAFENEPVEMTWRESWGPLTLVNGKGDGKVTWSIVDGTDVAEVNENGKITIYQTGSFTVEAVKAGDDCYKDSAAIRTTILVTPAKQTGFGFAEESVTLTYNDNNNKFTLKAEGGQSKYDAVYEVISGDAAEVNAATGEVTLVKSGTVVIQATKSADNRYSETTANYTLTIEKDEQSFTFDHSKAIAEKYGLLSFATQITATELNSGVVTYAVSGDAIGADVDNAGLVTFANSDLKVGTVTVTVTMEGDDCYEPFTDSYTITLSYEEVPAEPYTLHGNKIISESDWFTGDVTILAPNGYQISYGNDLTDNEWNNSVIWNEDGEANAWSNGNEPVIYLKNSTTGAITDAISVADMKLDTQNPYDLTISYADPIGKVILKTLTFGIYEVDELEITVSAKDDTSKIASLIYNYDGTDHTVNADELDENGCYTFKIPAQHRNSVKLKAVDNAGRSTELADGMMIVLDTEDPTMQPEYAVAQGVKTKWENGIFYAQNDVKVTFTITESNADLSGLELLDENGAKTEMPVLTVNDEAVNVEDWSFNEEKKELTGSYTLEGEGDYVLKLSYKDPSGNVMEDYTQEVRIDHTAPVIVSGIVESKYYTEEQTFVLTVTEHNFDASKVVLDVDAVNSNKDSVPEQAEIDAFTAFAKDLSNWDHTEGTDVYELKLPITVDGNYTVTVDCTDVLDLPADTYAASFTLDKDAPKYPVSSYEVVKEETILGKLFGFSGEKIQVSIETGDDTSGIDTIAISVNPVVDPEAATDLDLPVNLIINADGTVAMGDPGFIENITVTGTPDALTYKFDLPAQFRGDVSATVYDKAKLKNSSYDTDGIEIVVDSIAPQVEIAFAGDRQDAVKADADNVITRETMDPFGADTRFVYNGNVTATIKVTEANFFPANDDMTIWISCDGEDIADLAAAGITDSGWVLDEGVYTRTFVMTKDGDYRLFAEYMDHSENKMVWTSDEYEAKASEYEYASNIHTIDTQKPVVTVTYIDKDTDVAHTNYHSDDRIAKITVTDRNFRPNEIDFRVTAVDINKNPVAAFDYESLKLNQWINGTETVWAKTTEADTWETQVKIPFSIDATYTVAVDYKDIATNEAVINPFETSFTVDHNAPEACAVTYSTNALDEVLEAITFGYFEADRTVTLTATDMVAGVEYFTVTATAEGPETATDIELPNDLKIYVADKRFEGTSGFLTADKVTISNENGVVSMAFDVPAQFRGKICFTATDMGHLCSDDAVTDKTIVVDTIDPVRTVTYTPDRVVDNDTLLDVTEWDESSAVIMYYSKDAVTTFQITEANFYKEDVEVTVNGKPVTLDNENWMQGEADNIWTNTLTLKDEGDYVIKMSYADRSSNVMKEYTSQRIVIDKTAPKINVAYDAPLVDGKNTRNYFAKTQTATITITEHNFRADDAVIKVKAKNVMGEDKVSVLNDKGAEVIKELKLNEDGTVTAYSTQGASRSSWTEYEGNWRRADDTYVITLTFADFANYTFDIEYQDLATNPAADYVPDLFTVDNAKPYDLDISYSANVFDVILNGITFGYYDAKVDVTISATDNTAGVDHFVYSYLLADNVSSVNAQEENLTVAAERIGDTNRYTASFKIPMKDLTATTQFNGSVNFTAFDRSGNEEVKDDAASVRVIVDNIAPTANISYNTPVQTANGISYYDGNINATIQINEANFDANDVVVTVTKGGANYPVNVYWTDNSVDVHTGTFTLTEDGDYTVSVQYTDKSENTMTAYTSNQMTLDKTMPVIEVSNIKANSANKDEKYSFVITVNDTNLDASTLMPVLKAVVQKEDGVYASKDIDLGEPVAVVNGKTYTYTVEDLPEDGLYTLTCSVQDMSANTMSQVVLDDGNSYEQVQFSINRNGSVFGYGNQFSEDLVGKYYIYSVDEDVAIVEVNVDPIEQYKVELNGNELVEGEDYTTEQTSNNGEWSKRTYTIKKELFAEEGEYNIIVSSVDKAETTAYSDVKNLTLAFVVDQTKPVLTITGMEAGGRYQTDLQTVTLIPSDEGGRLNSLKVVILDASGEPLTDEAGADISVRFDMSGEELLQYLEANDGKITFTIPSGLNNQVKIICNDCAVNAEGLTNEYNELFTRVTVSQNQFVIFYANTPAFVGTIVGVLAIAGLIIFLIKRKKAKKTAAKA